MLPEKVLELAGKIVDQSVQDRVRVWVEGVDVGLPHPIPVEMQTVHAGHVAEMIFATP